MIAHNGIYQWKRVPFGLCSAPSCIQKMIPDMRDGFEASTNLLEEIVAFASHDADDDGKLVWVLHHLSKHWATITFEKAEFEAE